MNSLAPARPSPAPLSALTGALTGAVPGVLLCTGVAGLSVLLQQIEARLFGRAWLEALVIAILLGAGVRTVWTPHRRFDAGVAFSAKTVLEVSIVLLGAAVSARLLLAAGPALPAAVMTLVCAAVAASYVIGRSLGLPHRLATLIACGNSICGNSAIAAVAPVIGAEGEEIAASIAFTAVLGVLVVLILPVAGHLMHMTPKAFGVFAGLTVYAVPQVLPATSVVSALSAQVGVLVKLMRVLMLGPVILGLSLLGRSRRAKGEPIGPRPALGQLAPWFIIGFVVVVGLRSAGLIPAALAQPANQAATFLTIVSMAAMGLGVDVRAVARASGRVTLAVVLSLAALAGLALVLIRALGVA